MLNTKIKEQHLNTLKEYRKSLMTNPQLRYLFLELTMKCNERCIHCYIPHEKKNTIMDIDAVM